MSQIAVFDDILGSKFEPSKVQGTENNQLEFPYKMIQFVTFSRPLSVSIEGLKVNTNVLDFLKNFQMTSKNSRYFSVLHFCTEELS